MLFERDIQPELKREVETKEIVVLTGMRRTGKTTLMKMLFDSIKSKNKAFFDLENILEQQIFEETDFNNIWKNLSNYSINN